MLQEMLKMRVIKPCHSPCQNLWYLVKKSIPEKYWLVHIRVKLNWVIIWDGNLPLSINKFFEKFTSYIISSLIYYFSSYDHVELAEESRDLIAFITPLKLMQIMILAQDITNLIIQFVRIKFKILALHL